MLEFLCGICILKKLRYANFSRTHNCVNSLFFYLSLCEQYKFNRPVKGIIDPWNVHVMCQRPAPWIIDYVPWPCRNKIHYESNLYFNNLCSVLNSKVQLWASVIFKNLELKNLLLKNRVEKWCLEKFCIDKSRVLKIQMMKKCVNLSWNRKSTLARLPTAKLLLPKPNQSVILVIPIEWRDKLIDVREGKQIPCSVSGYCINIPDRPVSLLHLREMWDWKRGSGRRLWADRGDG